MRDVISSVEQGGGAARADTSDSPAAAAEAEAVATEHVASVSVGVVAADREAFDGDGVEHVRQSRLSRWQEQRG
jgi:hypothetical protein